MPDANTGDVPAINVVNIPTTETKSPDPVVLTRAGTDWEKQLEPDEVMVNKEGKKSVFLKGLQRLARRAGLVASYPQQITHCIGPDSKGVIQCVYMTRFSDGAEFGGAADVNSRNSQAPFIYYPTSLAESRAEARALRKALGITMLASEEIDFSEGYDGRGAVQSGKADQQQIVVIENMLNELSIEPITLIKDVIKREIFDIKDMTPQEAVDAMRWLNEQRSSKSSLSRSARKEQLKASLGGDN